MAVLSAPRGFG